MAELFETIMVVCFGASWPLSLYKSITSRTARGKSLLFECLIWIGYVFGITGKLLNGKITYVFAFYILITMVTLDILVYFRNYKLDRLGELQK